MGWHNIRVSAAVLLLWSAAAPAKQVQPPLTALRTPAANTVSATVLAVASDPPSLSVRVEQTLAGRPRTEFRILVDARFLPYVETGGRYLLVYGDLEPVEGKPGTFRQTEEGRLLSFDGAEPAAFRDTPEMRALLDPAHAQVEGRAQYRTEVLDGLASEDPHLQNLWAGELAFRAEVVEALEAPDFDRLAAFVNNPDSHPSARTRLLATANLHAPQLGTSWFVDSARKLVTTLPIDGGAGLISTEALAFTAFDVLRTDNAPLPQEALTRWVRSPSPALAEQALLKLRAQAPEVEAAVVETALTEHLLPAATRSFLIDHLRRLRLSNP